MHAESEGYNYEGSKKSVNMESEQFPAGLKVLVVDDDPICLMIIERMLKACQYHVTTSSLAITALSMLREGKNRFDIVISDVYMPDMDGLKLLEHIGLEMDLPVIMMSADDSKEVVMKGVTHGACDYLIKPIKIEALKNIWQHVVRKKRNEMKDLEHSGSIEENDKSRKSPDNADNSSSVNEDHSKPSKRKKDVKEEEEDGEEREDTSTLKKQRVVWSSELHQQFVQAVSELGIDKAVPKKILEAMNVPGLTRENVASHLQKYRLYLRRLSGGTSHQGGIGISYLGSSESSYGLVDGVDLHALSVSGQFLPQNLAALQTRLGRAPNHSVMPFVNQMNFLNSNPQVSDSSKRCGPIQQMNQRQQSFLHRFSTISETKQMTNLNQSLQPLKNVQNDSSLEFLSIPTSLSSHSSSYRDAIYSQGGNSIGPSIAQPVSIPLHQSQIPIDLLHQSHQNGQYFNGFSPENASICHKAVPSDTGNQLFERIGLPIASGEGSSGRISLTNPSSISQGSGINFQHDPQTELPIVRGSSSSYRSSIIFPDPMPITKNTENLNNAKATSGSPVGSLFSTEIQPAKNQGWEHESVNTSYEAQFLKSLQGSLDIRLSAQGHPTPICSPRIGSNRDLKLSCDHDHAISVSQNQGNLLGENPFQVKAESIHNLQRENIILGVHPVQDDLMNPLFKQTEGTGPDNVFNFEEYNLDDIQV